jgi:5'-3' exonuclease
VRGERVVQVDRRSGNIRDERGVREKFGVGPERIPDWLALVGDAADGYPGIAGIGPVTAARLIAMHGPIEDFPPAVIGVRRDLALLFKDLATLRTDAPLFRRAEEFRWRGPTTDFAPMAERFGDARLLERSLAAARIAATGPPVTSGSSAGRRRGSSGPRRGRR